ncbi:MBF transcription factor complex subunit Cdc10 [Schizosaccharomyces japonicus yFS275]|uniref:MBF transcription factor complex subunit Cdc10 n=1 Tax=Schizosaccharomyces japonicus (strain yFS275 / FY16936) TaxID=402676 RepID=B6K188_SCHJY|nr:MBF transcription factor complex subunit Cdc10 [Schizosaccharomyces japonicus yFS275]EEB07709.1 MBF transcription factor complex subunit Cdc10 [Schizosaccharomyces japonicus yFS275]
MDPSTESMTQNTEERARLHGQQVQNSLKYDSLMGNSVNKRVLERDIDQQRLSLFSQSQKDGSLLNLYSVSYSGQPYIELFYHGKRVLRRCSDSYVNLSHVLQLIGSSPMQIARELDPIIAAGDFENVDGRDAELNGVWVPLSRIGNICEKHGLTETLKPLLSFNTNALPNNNQTTSGIQQSQSNPDNTNISSSFSRPKLPAYNDENKLVTTRVRENTNDTPNAFGPLAAPESNDIDESMEPSAKKQKSTSGNGTSLNSGNLNSYNLGKLGPSNTKSENNNGTTVPVLNPALSFTNIIPSLPPLQQNSTQDFAASRDVLTSIFLDSAQENAVYLQAKVSKALNMDVPIDELGNTALHWAAALARIPLIEVLVRNGANPLRGNYSGETALHRAVLVTNHFNQSSFHELLDLLYSSLIAVDHSGRTVLHHICLTGAVKGRGSASRYYLETFLQWSFKFSCNSKNFTLSSFVENFLNYQDKNGDTALNICARIGNKAMVHILMQAGASIAISNRAGLSAKDYGIFGDQPIPVQNASVHDLISRENETNKGNVDTLPVQNKSQEIVSSVTEVITSLDRDFQDEMAAKQSMVDSTYAQLREATKRLADLRQQLDRSRRQADLLSELRQRSKNLELSIQEQKSELARIGEGSHVGFNSFSSSGMPIAIDEDPSKMSVEELQRFIYAYEKNEQLLNRLSNELWQRNSDIKSKCRRVVSLCTGVEEERVDSLLESLLQAVESDGQPGEVDMGRVAGFLRVVKEHQT